MEFVRRNENVTIATDAGAAAAANATVKQYWFENNLFTMFLFDQNRNISQWVLRFLIFFGCYSYTFLILLFSR